MSLLCALDDGGVAPLASVEGGAAIGGFLIFANLVTKGTGGVQEEESTSATLEGARCGFPPLLFVLN